MGNTEIGVGFFFYLFHINIVFYESIVIIYYFTLNSLTLNSSYQWTVVRSLCKLRLQMSFISSYSSEISFSVRRTNGQVKG